MSYASMIAGSLDMVTETIVMRVRSGGTLDPSTGAVSGETETSKNVEGLFTSYEANLVDGSTIRSGDLKCEVPSHELDFTPTAGDTIERNSAELEVVRVEQRVIGDEVVSYHLQVRGNG